MREAQFRDYLRRTGVQGATIDTRVSCLRRIETCEGVNLDLAATADGLRGLLDRYSYSIADERAGLPNPTAIPIEPERLRKYVAWFRSHLLAYARFAQGEHPEERQRARPPGREKPTIPIDAVTFADFGFDGVATFEAIVASSQYGTLAQAVASLTVFSHPDTVRQTRGKGVFPTVRGAHSIGQLREHESGHVVMDDNKSPTDAFLWANRLGRRGRDTQFNHVYPASADPDAYTALPNICMTPAFIAKLTDTSPAIRDLLRYRSYDLYGWHPRGTEAPSKPDVYDELNWAQPLPPVIDVEAALRSAMATKPKDRTVRAALNQGWLFQPKP